MWSPAITEEKTLLQGVGSGRLKSSWDAWSCTSETNGNELRSRWATA